MIVQINVIIIVLARMTNVSDEAMLASTVPSRPETVLRIAMGKVLVLTTLVSVSLGMQVRIVLKVLLFV